MTTRVKGGDCRDVGIDDDERVTLISEMSNDAVPARHAGSLELPVAELLRRARPLPSLEEMVIDDLSDEEAEAFLAALRS